MHERKLSHVNNSRRTVSTSNTSTTSKPTRPNRRGTQQRTGRTPLTSSTNQQHATDDLKETQQRIAARAATAMAQFRRRQPRTYLCWGDNRKATIKRYPDGTQEILVPQTLTLEQEHYEFPPRSRLLKKLANSTAERKRLSSLQHDIPPPNVSPTPPTHHSNSILMTNSTRSNQLSILEPDQNALTEWFSGRRRQYRQQQQEQQEQQEQDRHHQKQPSAKEKAVLDWMTDIERSTSLLETPSKRSIENHSSSSPKVVLDNIQDIGIHFKRKLLASGSSCQKLFGDLSPPDEETRKHYVRRRRLIHHGNKPLSSLSTRHPHQRQHQHRQKRPERKASVIIKPPFISHQVPRPTMSASPTTKSGMVQLVQMFHKTLQEQQARAHERMQQLETLLEEERCKRQDIQRTQQITMSRLDHFMEKYQEHRTPPSPTLSAASSSSSISIISTSRRQSSKGNRQSANWMEWIGRINRLETSVENECKSRLCLQRSVDETVKRMDALKQSLSTQESEHTMARHQLEMKINKAFDNLAKLTQHRYQ
ncbi:hypothetical protein BC941DRAFT_208800 [Chlamydoabsidia padenii]|nr:hypothetical protein BC941DRAFT_208800 [Chlamydoabsidia padenii]